MCFEQELEAICQKAAGRSQRDERARADNGSAAYWAKQSFNMENGGSYDLLTPWIYTGDVNALRMV